VRDPREPRRHRGRYRPGSVDRPWQRPGVFRFPCCGLGSRLAAIPRKR
jgi:hypothetical protein